VTALLQTHQALSLRRDGQHALKHSEAPGFHKLSEQEPTEVLREAVATSDPHSVSDVRWPDLGSLLSLEEELKLHKGLPPEPYLTSSELWATGMLVVLLVLFDVCAVANRVPSRLYNVLVFFFFVAASKVHSLCVGMGMGWTHGTWWFAAYMLELVLSMNNLFAYYLIFKAFAVPVRQSASLLTLGIYGAMALRVVCTVCLSSLFALSHSVNLAVGLILIFSGALLLYEEKADLASELATVKFFKRCFGFRLQGSYDDSRTRLIAWSSSGHLQITMSCLVIGVISVTDILFSVDSMGVKLGQVNNLYINISSTLMAMASLRSLFFIIGDMADTFCFVKYGMCLILGFVGIAMVVSKWYHVPSRYMLLTILVIFSITVLASLLKLALGTPASKDVEEEKGSNQEPKLQSAEDYIFEDHARKCIGS